MPLINGYKYSCGPCIRGHRATSCAHTDRILIEVRKPGRPLESCGHKLDSCSCGRLQDIFSIGDTPLEEPFIPPMPQILPTPQTSKPKPKSRARPENKVSKRPPKKNPASSTSTPTLQSPPPTPQDQDEDQRLSSPTLAPWSPPLPTPPGGFNPYDPSHRQLPHPGAQSRVEDIAMASNPQTQQDTGQAYVRSGYISTSTPQGPWSGMQ